MRNNSLYKKYIKRFLDIFISFFAILLLSPVFLITYILNLIFIGFPCIFKQIRPGKDNKLFCIYKFRSMTNKKDKNGNLLPDSQRITLWGKILRKTSLDELPQLFNILFGTMTIVGYRTKLVKDLIFYPEDAFYNNTSLPGLTGPTQTNGRTENTWEQTFAINKEYSNNITFRNDLKIFFKTFISVFKDTGESHSTKEENSKQKVEYYYADYLLRTSKITKEQYDYGQQLAKDIIAGKEELKYHPELLDLDLFNKMQKDKQN